MDSVITTYFRLDECKEISDTLNKQIEYMSVEIDALNEVLTIQSVDSAIMEEMIATLNKTNSDLKNGIKKENRKKFWSGFVWGGLTLAAIETVAILFIVLK